MGTCAELPEPARVRSLDDVAGQLRELKVWAGDPSYGTIKDRVNAAWTAAGRPASELAIRSTVAHCFRPGRHRLNTSLVIAIVEALHPDAGYVTQWRQALRVLSGETEAASQVRVQDRLPLGLTEFTGRTAELDRLREAGADTVVTIEGMAGAGKTQLAVQAGHLLHREKPFDRILFVDLRGFHPEPAQPPADPAAVLDGFLRLLGVPGHRVPHGLDARAALYRERLEGSRVLVILDNAAGIEQAGPLVPGTLGSLTLVTSRRRLGPAAPRLAVGVFPPEDAIAFLARALPGVPTGPDPGAAARIARRCGHLPLALGLIVGHIRATPGWTLTDHADRLDERHRDRRLETGVELALALSYQCLPEDRQRLLRLVALHPGQEFDAWAAAALTGADPGSAADRLAHLHGDHVLRRTGPDRYSLHDLVRSYAAARAHDLDPPAQRRAALTRLLDHYAAATAAAMNVLYPAEAYYRQRIDSAGAATPDLAGPDAAIAWLDAERVNLVAATVHAACGGWREHTIRLAGILSRYLHGGYYDEALTVHRHAFQAARDGRDRTGEAHALLGMGIAYARLGRAAAATGNLRRALVRYRQAGDPAGQARTLYQLGAASERSGDYAGAAEHIRQALALHRLAGDLGGEATALVRLGGTARATGRVAEAIDYCREALTLTRRVGHWHGEAFALSALGEYEALAGRYGPAHDHLQEALTLTRRLGNPGGMAGTLDALGLLYARLGHFEEATRHYRRSLAIAREIGHQSGEADALIGLADAVRAAGRAADALAHYASAHTIASAIGARGRQARAQAGLGHAHRALGDTARARRHYRHAAALFTELGVPEALEMRSRLAALEV